MTGTKEEVYKEEEMIIRNSKDVVWNKEGEDLIG